eukprot:5637523-Pyramimonas_sp.AAC.1
MRRGPPTPPAPAPLLGGLGSASPTGKRDPEQEWPLVRGSRLEGAAQGPDLSAQAGAEGTHVGPHRRPLRQK